MQAQTSPGPESRIRVAGRAVARPSLSPAAESLAQLLVFAPRRRPAFVAAARGKRMLVDIGRIDAPVATPARRAAAREAISARAPVAKGDSLFLRGPWGGSLVRISGFDVWNGRIVATVEGDPRLDSLARRVEPLPAVATRPGPGDSTFAAPVCQRELPPGLLSRLAALRDSLGRNLLAALPPGRAGEVRGTYSQLGGCFGPWRAALAVSLRTPNVDVTAERIVMLDSAGGVTALRVNDLRLRVHDLLVAFDADGDGVDDVATRALRERAGATSILRLDPRARTMSRLASGFAWER